MSDLYHHFLTSMSGVGVPPAPGQNPQDIPPLHPPPQQPLGMPMAGSPIPNSYQSLGYFTGFPDPIMFNTQKAQRSRRKPSTGLDHIKHRRTRSGCYTCRSRRVKCDETHPICERCRKGKRDCSYPEPTSKTPTGQGSSLKESTTFSQQTSPISSHEDDEEEEEGDRDSKLETIPDEDEPETPTFQSSMSMPPPRRMSTASSLNLHRPGTRQGSETPSIEGTKSSSPSISTPTGLPPIDPSLSGSGPQPDLSQLPHDLRFYMTYFCDHITHFHYSMVNDSEDFVRNILPGIAFRNEALLYAVVGFAAYHHALKDPRGRIQEFLQYYNRSVSLLLSSLKRKERASIATLITILQLATIEEYLGDWVNLMGHQRAAFEVLGQLFTPQTIMHNAATRFIYSWYARFDIFVSLMAGTETSFSRDWFTGSLDFCKSRIISDPDNIVWRIDESSAQIQLVSVDMANFYARLGKGGMEKEAFSIEHKRISQRLLELKSQWDPTITNASFLVTDFNHKRPPSPDDIVDPFSPGSLYHPPLFATTLLTCHWHSIFLMHESQAMVNTGLAEPSEELTKHSLAICQIFEAVEVWPLSPRGSLVAIQACLAIAALFVPRDSRHHMWMRKKFALMELMGCGFPMAMRSRMAEIFNDASCGRWWLPNEEGFTLLLHDIRTLADERNAAALAAQPERLAEIKHVFSKLELGRAGDPALEVQGKEA